MFVKGCWKRFLLKIVKCQVNNQDIRLTINIHHTVYYSAVCLQILTIVQFLGSWVKVVFYVLFYEPFIYSSGIIFFGLINNKLNVFQKTFLFIFINVSRFHKCFYEQVSVPWQLSKGLKFISIVRKIFLVFFHIH